MKHPIVKRFLPHLLALLSFVAISAIYFYPAFNGYQLNQGDVTHFRGMAQEIVEYRAMFGEDPLWTNSMFGGMPAYQISVQHPNHIIAIIDDVVSLGLPRPANYLFLYLVGFYILMIALRLKPSLAAIGAVAFAFGSYYFIILQAGHNTKAHAIGYMAPIIAGVVWAYRGRILFGSAIAALFVALEIEANHVQITYYLGFLVLFMVIVYAVRAFQEQKAKQFLQASATLLIAALLGVAANLNNLWPTYEYGEYSIRGATDLTITPSGSSNEANTTDGGLERDYVTQWSYGVDETLTLLVANFMGGSSGALIDQNTQREDPQKYRDLAQGYQATQVFPNSYWGDQPFTSGPVYVGAAVVLLFVLGLFFVKSRLKWALLATAILTIALSWGKNFMGLTNFFLDYIPGYNKFRAVTILLSITGLVFPMLGFMFIRQLDRHPEIVSKRAKLFLAVSGGLTLLLIAFAAVPQVFFNFLSTQENEIFSNISQGENGTAVLQYVSALQDARAELFVADAIRSLLIVILLTAVLWMFASGKIKQKVFIVALAVLVLADLFPISKRYVNNEKDKGRYLAWQKAEATESAYPVMAADTYILQRETDMNPRVADAVNEAVVKTRSTSRGTSKKAAQDKVTNAQFAALRFNTDYRVLSMNNPFQDARTSYFHSSIGGYHGAKLRRIMELNDFYIAKEIQSLAQALQGTPDMNSVDRAIQQMDISNMLNAKYIVYNPEAPPFENEYAFGSAWFVEYLKSASTADEEILALDELELKTEAVVGADFQSMVEGFDYEETVDARIAVQEHLPNYISYIYDSPVPQATIFSEIYYPEGWNAYVDGEPAEYFRANYTLRGMIIPAGNHTIEFKFEPQSYATASTISTIAGLIICLILVFSVYKNYKTPEKDVYEELFD